MRTVKEYQQEYAKKKLQRGICRWFGCWEPYEEGKTMCRKHLREMVDRLRILRSTRKGKGLCIYCGTRPSAGTLYCLECRKQRSGLKYPERVPVAMRKELKAEEYRKLREKQREKRRMALESLHSPLWADLPSRTISMIESYYGLRSGVPMTLTQIGDEYGITRERVRQIIWPFKAVGKELGLNRKGTERVG